MRSRLRVGLQSVMSLTAEATVSVQASPQAVLEFVLDVDRYREVDRKIIRVSSVDKPDIHGKGSVKIWGRLGWLPPAPDRQDFHLEQWSRLRFVGARRQPARAVFDFVGTFACSPPVDGATTVTHAYEFTFKGPFRIVERFLKRWLQREIEDEVRLLGAAVESKMKTELT
jgi:Polyketide cyclase / dehydrase and lipid transport